MKDTDTTESAPKDPLIETIRARVVAYIGGAPGYEGMSLRELSRRIGMSASGLTKFADGAMPYTPTRRKLLRWYRALVPATREEQKRDGLSLLLADMAPAQRAEAERQIQQILAAYEAPAAGAAGNAAPRRPRRTKRAEGGAGD
jgi:transcriptional regulator with XRE-family HTH domain